MKKNHLFVILSMSVFSWHPSCEGESGPDFHERLNQTGRDGVYLLASPMRLGPADILPSLAIGGAIAATFAYDNDIRDRLVRLRAWGGRQSLADAGNVLQFGGLIGGAGLFVYGKTEDDSRTLNHAWLQVEGGLYSLIVGQGLKYVVGRARPSETDPDPDNLKPFSSQDSFPSGHTLSAFTAAQLAAEEYPSYAVRIPVYALATGTGISRLAVDKHWAGDVVTSAILGMLMGHTLYRAHKRPASDWRLLVEPEGLRITKAF